MLSEDEIRSIRDEKIKARNALSPEDKKHFEAAICQRLLKLSQYQKAKTIMIYKGVRGEVRLDGFEVRATQDGKILLYPLTLKEGRMIAVNTGPDESSWKENRYGLKEPVVEKGKIIAPKDIDLIICPCTAFDENLNRLGMGGGYYDRFLPGCVNAFVLAAAFEVQKCRSLSPGTHDFLMQAVVTEKSIYRRNPSPCDHS